jgi:hypothetical protein
MRTKLSKGAVAVKKKAAAPKNVKKSAKASKSSPKAPSKKKVEPDWELCRSGFAAAAESKMTSADDKRLLRRLTPFRMTHAADRAIRKAQAAGVNVGDVQSFLQWIIDNWSTILEMIKSIIALFGG